MSCLSTTWSKPSNQLGECGLSNVRSWIVITSSLHRTDPCQSFLYILYLAVDANFKLKGKDRKLQDIELMPGGGAFVEESAYQEHIKNYVDQPEVRRRCLTTAFLY